MEWRRVLAGTVLLLASFFAGLVASQPDETTNYENCVAIKKFTEIIGSAVNNHSSNNSQNHEYEPDCNPPKWYASAKRPEWWLVVAGFITIPLIWRQVRETARSVKTAELQSQITARQLEIAERPWVYAETSISGPLTVDERGVYMVFRIALHNCGHTPAVGVNIRPVLYVLNNAKPHPVEERKRMCEELAKGGMAGETIFPGNEMVRTYTMNALAADIQRSVTPAGGYYAMNLILCIAYRSTFAEKAATCYYTGIVYDLRRNSPSYQGAFIINQGVHASALRVSESVFFGQIAT